MNDNIEDQNIKKECEFCYNYCESVGWNPDRMRDVSLPLKYTPAIIKHNAKLYMTQYLKLPKEVIKNKMDLIRRAYVEGFPLHSMPDNVLKELKIEKDKTSDMVWLTEYGKERVLKYLYEYCSCYGWKKTPIEKLASRWGLRDRFIKDFAKKYMKDTLGMTIDEINDEISSKKRTTTLTVYLRNRELYDPIYEKIIETDDLDELISCLSVAPEKLLRMLSDYNTYNPDKSNYVRVIIERLNNVIKSTTIQEDGKRIVKESVSLLKVSKDMINSYVNSKYKDTKSFCVDKKIDAELFYKYLLIVKEKDSDLYKLYCNKIILDKKSEKENMIETAKKVAHYIENGILDGEEMKPFDLYDYYELTKYNLEELFSTTQKDLSFSERNILYDFCKKNKSAYKLLPTDIKAIMNEITYVGCQYDKNNNPIYETGREITKEDKMFVIEYLKKNNNLNSKTYCLAMRRFIKGKLNNSSNELQLKGRG